VDKAIAETLNREGFVGARGCTADASPPERPDGSYSIQGAAATLGVMLQTILNYLARGLLTHRLTKGEP
jgi:hypothetical protein